MLRLRTRFFIALTALMLLIPFSLAEDSAENLIWNPEVDTLSGWVFDVWDTSEGMTVHALDDTGYDDGTSLYLENAAANDARFLQSVWVEPDTLYRVSCYVKAEDIGTGAIGANLSIKDISVYSESVYDTDGEWRYLEMYGETGPEQTDLILMARIGGYSSVNTGKAWFDHFSMTKVDELPDGAMLMDFSTPSTGAGSSNDSSAAEDVDPERNTEAFLLIACLFVAMSFAGWATVRRLNEGSPDLRGRGETPIFCCLLAAAFLFRIYLALRFPGYRVDIRCFIAWSGRMLDMGPYRFYDPASYFCDYPPVYLMMLAPVELLRRILSIELSGSAHIAMLKLWPILCDLIGAALIYNVGKKRIGATSAAALGTLHAFNIAGMAISAAWGQADSVLTLLIALTLLLAIDRRWIGALILYSLAVLTKPQALLFAPVGVAFFARDLLRDKENRRKNALAFFAGIAAAYLILLPFSLRLYSGVGAPVRFLIDLFKGTTGGYSYMTVNALNLYNVVDLNWTATSLHPMLTVMAWCLMLAGIAYGCVLTFVTKQRRDVLLISATVMAVIFAFGPMMHERYLYPCILLLALYYAMGRDRHVLESLIVCSAALFMNTVLVLQGGMGAGNFGHLHSSEQMVNAIVSLINVANALFLIAISFRVCVLGRAVRFDDAMPEPGQRGAEPPEGRRLKRSPDSGLALTKKDWLLMAAVTGLYAVIAFVNLGVTAAPQTEWVSAAAAESITFDLGETKPFRMTYYGGICDTHFTVALSDDGEHWSEPFDAQYDQGEIFRWIYYVPKLLEEGEFKNAYSGALDTPNAPKTFFVGEPLPAELAAFYRSVSYPPQQARYVRVSAANAGLRLREIAFLDVDGKPLTAEIVGHDAGLIAPEAAQLTGEAEMDDPAKLLDEQAVVPAVPSYLNSTYFDEIYHARTGYEMSTGEYNIYEWTHPPLGKVLIMAGINLFGMTPFGWRFMGTLFGVLMVPLMYLLAKQLTKNRELAFVAMALMALDSMHFTQSRIATVDTYAVFFIMLMYLFMFRYQQMNWNHDGLARTLIPLGLCGIAMGLGIATKWIGIYAAVGLAVIFFCTLWKRYAEHRYALRNCGFDRELLAENDRKWIALLAAFLVSCAALLLAGLRYALPIMGRSIALLNGGAGKALVIALAAISGAGYIAALILFRTAKPLEPPKAPMERAASNFWRNTTLTAMFCVLYFIAVPLLIYYHSYYWQLQFEGGLNLKRVIQLQESMYSYHAGLGGDTHYFRSPWYEWPVIWWPMWYYSGTPYMPEGVISSISCMGNPAVWWTGLAALIWVFWQLATKKRKPDACHLVVIGFLSQFLPWVLVPRSTFIYHYFASVPFIILCTALMLGRLRERREKSFRFCAATLLIAALILFVAFYPLESGMPVARSYARLLRWFRWYNF